ncbi:uncharacterized protein BX664DRAFT_331739 [Halteromyces radiatus]|uniref:uncharacterized protein n=1 Tax=Halteromyces radiatus TaxID=101107 RepID=UPI00221F98A3|nr:uncharacterized protein BX664DRAFT_331739 [Halteromyces radiatus]KAI8088925.1 hypothetical protein BX664DRAFT_331739 [Halteromyces radiatus]
MVARIETFPDVVVEQLVYLLEPNDLFQLSLTSKTLFSIYSNASVWRSKSLHDFGNLFHIYTLFTTSTGLELYPDIQEKFEKEPTDWCRYYLSKNASVNEQEEEKLMDEADSEYAAAQAQLKQFQNDGNAAILNEVAAKMIRILDVFPAHGGCYYILAFILFVLNQLEEAVILLQMGRSVDSSFEPIDELEEEIQRILKGYGGEEDEPPLLANDTTLSAPLTEALLEIFSNFDKDKDNALNNKELGNFIYETNGSHPPPPFLRQMGQRFGSNSQGWLTKDGFLAFYLEQTLDDPSETRSDLGVHGYDPHTLKKRMEE